MHDGFSGDGKGVHCDNAIAKYQVRTVALRLRLLRMFFGTGHWVPVVWRETQPIAVEVFPSHVLPLAFVQQALVRRASFPVFCLNTLGNTAIPSVCNRNRYVPLLHFLFIENTPRPRRALLSFVIQLFYVSKTKTTLAIVERGYRCRENRIPHVAHQK